MLKEFMGFIEKFYIILKYCDEYLHLLFIQNISLFLIGSNPSAKYS